VGSNLAGVQGSLLLCVLEWNKCQKIQTDKLWQSTPVQIKASLPSNRFLNWRFRLQNPLNLSCFIATIKVLLVYLWNGLTFMYPSSSWAGTLDIKSGLWHAHLSIHENSYFSRLQHCPLLTRRGAHRPDWANFRYLGECLFLGSFCLFWKKPKFLGYISPQQKLSNNFDKKIGRLGYKLGNFFSQTHPVTLCPRRRRKKWKMTNNRRSRIRRYLEKKFLWSPKFFRRLLLFK
jgi:hypothetical protein